MEKTCRQYLLALARAYARKNDLALTTVARRFHGTESFFADFAKGRRSITLRKWDEMIEAFQQEWPEDLKWPEFPQGR